MGVKYFIGSCADCQEEEEEEKDEEEKMRLCTDVSVR